MHSAMTVASFRRMTPAILASSRLAHRPARNDVTKAKAAITLKRAAPVLGISGTAYHVLDILLGLSHEDDWKGDARPIVAISNALLAEYVSRSERTVTRAIRQLVEAGILAYRDSPAGRRFINRDRDGRVLQAYGLDFTPARSRIEELRRIADDYQKRIQAERNARRTVTRLARAIADIAAVKPDRLAQEALHRLHEILELDLPVMDRARKVTLLHQELLESDAHAQGQTPHLESRPAQAADQAGILAQMTPKGDNCDASNKYTTHPDSRNPYGPGKGKVSKAGVPSVGRPSPPLDLAKEVLKKVPIGLLASTCRAVREFLPQPFGSWQELSAATPVFRAITGLDDDAWRQGQLLLGQKAASAVLAVVAEKFCRDPASINNVGGYFLAMARRGPAGTLNLAQTLHGLSAGAEALLKGQGCPHNEGD